MPKIQLCASLGNKHSQFLLSQDRIVIGKGHGCTVRLKNIPWIADQHLLIENRNEVVRICCLESGLKAYLSGKAIDRNWVLLPPGSRVAIPGPGDWPLILECKFEMPHHNAVVLREEAASNDNIFDMAAPIVTASARSGPGWSNQGDALSLDLVQKPAEAAPKAKPPFLPRHHRVAIISFFALCLAAAGVMVFNSYRRSSHEEQVQADIRLVSEKISQAQRLIERQEYTAAKAALVAAEEIAGTHPNMAPQMAQIKGMKDCAEIRYGAAGYVQMEFRWLPPDVAKAWQAVRERDDPKIAEFLQQAQAARAAKKLDEARVACEEALALMDTHPVKPHPREKEVKGFLEGIRKDVTAAEMTAKGYVLFQDKWVSPKEAFALQQQAKGLVEYRGKWLNKEEAFDAEQMDNGLVFCNGKWMTSDERMKALGFIVFEGQWVKPEEKVSILAKRAADAKAEQERLAAEKKRQQEEEARAQAEAAKEQALLEKAYGMSQEFVKGILKAPASAQFQKFGSAKVIVTKKDGWFIVEGVVDAQNSFGAMLRNTYHCKLRPDPTKPGFWEADYTFLE